MRLDKVPRQGAKVVDRHLPVNLENGVLVAHLAGNGQLQGALRQLRVLKLRQSAQCAVLQCGVSRSLVDVKQIVEQFGVAIARGDGERSVSQGRLYRGRVG